MKGALRAVTLAIMAAVQLSLPVVAQTTVLTGHVSQTRTPLLIEQRPIVDTRPATRTYPVTVSQTVVRPTVVRTIYVRDNRTFFQRHPKVKAATIGAGVGAAAGAVTGLVSGRGVVRGAAIGAGAGAGVGLVRSSRTLKRHPIVRDVATGTLVGLGIGGAASRRSGWAKGAGVGAAVGLGVGLLKNGLH